MTSEPPDSATPAEIPRLFTHGNRPLLAGLISVILLIACLPVVYLWVRNRREEREYLVEHRHVRCRARENQLVDCRLIRDAKTGEPVGIQSCSAQPGGVHCERECLPLFVKAKAA